MFGHGARYYYQLQMLKAPRTSAATAVMVALDPAPRANGCLKVVRGSNRPGRLGHQSSGSRLITGPGRPR